MLGIFVNNDCYGRVQPTVSSANCGKVVICCKKGGSQAQEGIKNRFQVHKKYLCSGYMRVGPISKRYRGKSPSQMCHLLFAFENAHI